MYIDVININNWMNNYQYFQEITFVHDNGWEQSSFIALIFGNIDFFGNMNAYSELYCLLCL